ncbi:MAG: hypothetical protein ABIP51_11220 [Bacteroidia bacterium]
MIFDLTKNIFSYLLLISLSLFFGCRNSVSTTDAGMLKDTLLDKGIFPIAKNLTDYQKTDFLPTLQNKISNKKNSIYCATLLFAWDKVKNIIQAPLKIEERFNDLILLNNSTSYIDVLKENEYSASGEIHDGLIQAKAEFKKSLPFEIKLTSFNNKLLFDKSDVASFGNLGKDLEQDFVRDIQISKIIQILYYKNDDNFIIKLSPKDTCHEIILFKSKEIFTTMGQVISKIEDNIKIGLKEGKNEKLNWKYFLTVNDDIIIPKFKFNIETNYKNIEQNVFQTNSKKFQIESMWQRTAFCLDESGAEIESEAMVAAAMEEEDEEKPKPKKMVFDKPFFLMVKRVENKSPYFAMWTNNSELMIKE